MLKRGVFACVVVLAASIDPLQTPQIFGVCPTWVGSRGDSGVCDKVNQFGACYAWKDFFRPLSGMDTQCLDKENYESYECPKVAPHKCKFHFFENVVNTMVESQQVFGKCPGWVGNRADSGMCDKVNLFGACYAWKDFFRPLSGMDTQCLAKENYESYECPKVAPHKCKFHSLENVVNTMVESQQLFGKCPGWVGNRTDSGMCDKVNLFGACFAWKDFFRPLSGMDTQCLAKENYESYECPKDAPHKCKFHSLENVVNTVVESQQIFRRCPGWVGNRADSGMCDKVNQFGACYAKKDRFRPRSGMDTQCLAEDTYKAYECPKVAPHKCKFHIFAEPALEVLV